MTIGPAARPFRADADSPQPASQINGFTATLSRKLLTFFIVLASVAFGVCSPASAQSSPIPGFPPGVFSNKAALDPPAIARKSEGRKGMAATLFCPNDQIVVENRCVPNLTRDASLPGLNGFARSILSPTAPTVTSPEQVLGGSLPAERVGVPAIGGGGVLLPWLGR
jgi:hypothetical protein